MTEPTTFVRFDSGVERPDDDEQKYLEEIVDAQRAIVERLGDRFRHGVRAVHSKSHGVLAGKLEVFGNLPAPYAQGLFAKPGVYDVVARISTNAGDFLPDDVSLPRGFAMKVLGPEGEAMLPDHEGERTQDFLLIDGPVLGAPKPKDFAQQMKFFLSHLDDPPAAKEAVSAVNRAVESTFRLFGQTSGPATNLGGHPPTHPLGATLYSQLATRHGDYVAKYRLAPESDSLKALVDQKIDLKDKDGLRNAIVSYFATQGGEWTMSVQLATDLEKMPVEDGATPWSEDDSPFVPVARLSMERQPAYAPERRVYADDILSFNPWHGLAAHQPLGAHNRARKVAYAMSTDHRHAENVRKKREPRDASEFFVVGD